MIEWTTRDLFDLLDVIHFDEYRDFNILYFDRYAVAKTEAHYQIHNRPAVYLIKNFTQKPYVKNLKIKSQGIEWYSMDTPLTLLTLGIDSHDPLMLRLDYDSPGPEVTQQIKDAIDVVAEYENTDEFHHIKEEKKVNRDEKINSFSLRYSLNDLKDLETKFTHLKDNFESQRQEYALVKLLLENFVLSNVLRIEELVRSNSDPQKEIDWDNIDLVFRSILFEKNLGIFSLDNAYDNLLQIREMCYDQHFKQLAVNTRLSYKECEMEWGRLYTAEWRKMQDIRIVYFYDRESIYYRDLFLTALIREPMRLQNFLTLWGSRLNYSLYLRQHLDYEMEKLKVELCNFVANFDDKDEFVGKIEHNLEIIKNNLSEFNKFLQMIVEKKLYIAHVGPK
jgi:hypothetical protein